MKEWIQINTIEGYENVKDQYWISSSDEDIIVNKNMGRIKKISINNYGYKRVNLQTKDGKYKTYKIHILKAKAFLFSPNLLTYNVVRHLNDCKIDNRLENLAWGTRSDNIQDSIRNGRYNYKGASKGGTKNGAKNGKKGSKPIRCIETGIIYSSACEASRQTGICNANISSCCRGRQHTAGGFHWEFVNPISES